jgi:hypothetical protein
MANADISRSRRDKKRKKDKTTAGKSKKGKSWRT